MLTKNDFHSDKPDCCFLCQLTQAITATDALLKMLQIDFLKRLSQQFFHNLFYPQICGETIYLKIAWKLSISIAVFVRDCICMLKGSWWKFWNFNFFRNQFECKTFPESSIRTSAQIGFRVTVKKEWCTWVHFWLWIAWFQRSRSCVCAFLLVYRTDCDMTDSAVTQTQN